MAVDAGVVYKRTPSALKTQHRSSSFPDTLTGTWYDRSWITHDCAAAWNTATRSLINTAATISPAARTYLQYRTRAFVVHAERDAAPPHARHRHALCMPLVCDQPSPRGRHGSKSAVRRPTHVSAVARAVVRLLSQASGVSNEQSPTHHNTERPTTTHRRGGTIAVIAARNKTVAPMAGRAAT